MKVFISWSGPVSHAAAKVLRDWLPDLLQALEPWVSSEDISKGSQWLQGVSEELQQVRYGILCVTPDNFGSPWMCFEAGAMSVAKGIGRQHVAPLLLGVQPGQLTGPLTQFQATEFAEAEVLKLAQSLNASLAEKGLSEERLARQFARLWPDLQKRIGATLQLSPPQPAKRPQEEMLEEIVETVRALNRQMDKIESTVETRNRMTAIEHVLSDSRNEPTWNDMKRLFDKHSNAVTKNDFKWLLAKYTADWDTSNPTLAATVLAYLKSQAKDKSLFVPAESNDPQPPAE